MKPKNPVGLMQLFVKPEPNKTKQIKKPVKVAKRKSK